MNQQAAAPGLSLPLQNAVGLGRARDAGHRQLPARAAHAKGDVEALRAAGNRVLRSRVPDRGRGALHRRVDDLLPGRTRAGGFQVTAVLQAGRGLVQGAGRILPARSRPGRPRRRAQHAAEVVLRADDGDVADDFLRRRLGQRLGPRARGLRQLRRAAAVRPLRLLVPAAADPVRRRLLLHRRLPGGVAAARQRDPVGRSNARRVGCRAAVLPAVQRRDQQDTRLQRSATSHSSTTRTCTWR